MTTEELIKRMDPGLFVAALKSSTKDGVLVELTEHLVSASRIKDGDVILEMLRNRESLGSTAVGSGVAFPHGRSLAIKDLTILLAISRKGVDFDSIDGKPTQLFFLLLAPPQDSGNLYLQALGAITGLVQNDQVRASLLEAKDFEGITNILREASV